MKTLAAALVAVCAVAFAIANIRDRVRQAPPPDDGVVWADTDAGVVAQYVRPGSPAASAGLQPGQILRAIYFYGAYEEISEAGDVRYYLDEAKVGGSLVYAVERINSRGVSMGVWEGDVKGIEPKPIEILWES